MAVPKSGKVLGTPPSYMKPLNFLRESKNKGKYIGWNTGNTTKQPDFGKGNAGPGIPYREVEQNMPKSQSFGAPMKPKVDAKAAAIRRRLNNGQA